MATKSLAKKPTKKPLSKTRTKPRLQEATCADGWPLVVPVGAGTLKGFRAWSSSPEFPEKGKIAFFNGEIFIDMSPERLDSHVAVKAEITHALYGLINHNDLGVFYADGARIVHVDADVSNEPDAMFVSWESFDSKRVRLIRTKEQDDFIELEGSPDLVVEIISPGSVTKDLKKLRERYLLAGIPEYWLIDARAEKIHFQILRSTSEEYEEVVPKAGWHASAVLGKSVRLSRKKNRIGTWIYRLETK